MTRFDHRSIEETSSVLSWREFEEFAESVFRSFGFATIRNLRLKKPSAEIDLLATKSGLAFVVDCKHWKRTVGRATMFEISERQIGRARRVAQLEGFEIVIPLILTLHNESLHILENGIPIVPIQEISDFILNWEVAPEIRVLSKQSD